MEPDDSCRKREAAEEDSGGPSEKRRKLGFSPVRILHKTSRFGRYLDTIAILVGFPPSRFTAHVGVLLEKAPFLAEKLLGTQGVEDYAAEGNREHTLPSEEKKTFRIFMVWLYTRDRVAPSILRMDDPEEEAQHDVWYARLVIGTDGPSQNHPWRDEDLIDVYLLGQRYRIDALSTSALSILADQNYRRQRATSADAVSKVFNAPPWQNEFIRKYLILRG